MRDILKEIIINFLRSENITEKITGFKVKKQRRGTYQALEESKEIEKDIGISLLDYIDNWYMNEVFHGEINKIIKREIKNQLFLELVRRGYGKM